ANGVRVSFPATADRNRFVQGGVSRQSLRPSFGEAPFPWYPCFRFDLVPKFPVCWRELFNSALQRTVGSRCSPSAADTRREVHGDHLWTCPIQGAVAVTSGWGSPS